MSNQSDGPDPQVTHRVSVAQPEPEGGEHYPGNYWLPEIPSAVNWATALFILSAIPLLLVFAANVFSAPALTPGSGFPASGYGVMLLLNIGYLTLAVSVLNGRKWTRITITVVTVIFNFFVLSSIAGFDLYDGLVGESHGSFVHVVLAWTVVLSSAGLILLYTPASNTYVARSETYEAYYLDQRKHPSRSTVISAKLAARSS
jgi:hypothetical protein